MFPSPGPTFEIEVAAPEIAVTKSRPVKDNNAAKIKNITKYRYMNEIIQNLSIVTIGSFNIIIEFV